MNLCRVLLACLLFQTISCAFPIKYAEPSQQDPQSAIDSGDVTALIEGCGVPLTTGFIVCRKTEGDAASDSLTFVAPPVSCQGAGPCVTFKIFFLDGGPAYGGSITKGSTRISVPWSTILKRDTFQMGDRGFWGFSYEIRYKLGDGIERVTYSQGEIYLRVMKKGYTALHSVKDDRHFVWHWKENKTEVKATTGMRTWIGGDS